MSGLAGQLHGRLKEIDIQPLSYKSVPDTRRQIWKRICHSQSDGDHVSVFLFHMATIVFLYARDRVK
jgi:hypothetical protein